MIAGHLNYSTATHRDSTVNMAPRFTIRNVAPANTLEHRLYIEQDGTPVSPWHDIPLYANQEQSVLNMVVEIPRWTNAKLEASQDRNNELTTS